MRPAPAVLLLAGLLLALPVLPGVPTFWLTLLNNVGLAALVALGLVLLTGVGGITSFGQAAFCGFGAYATAVLSTAYGVSPWLVLPVALLITGASAVVLGLVTVRLSGHFLPLGTIAWGLSLYYAFGRIDALGRHDGIAAIPPLRVADYALSSPAANYYVVWGFVLLALLLSRNLLDSRTGRAIRALRGGTVAAEAFGVDASRLKSAVFVYAALLAGLSGWLYAHLQRAVNPTPFGLNAGIEYLFMAVLGGAGQIWGTVIGAGVVVLLKDLLQRAVAAFTVGQVQLEGVVFGFLLVAILQVARDGVWPLIAARFKQLPPAAIRIPARPLPRPRRPPPQDVLLELDGASKSFGGLVAMDGVSLSVKGGEIVALIGPNGAGKSTTFNLVTGVLQPSRGTVRFGKADITGAGQRAVARLGIARTFQEAKLFPTMTVLENVALGAHLRGRRGFLASMLRLDRREDAMLLAEAAHQLKRVELAGEMHRPAGTLALGQQRIVEIARALCLDPVLLLLDEPAAGLRHIEKQRLADLLRQLRTEGVGVLLVEHDMSFVMDLADRVVVLDFGTKIAEGPPDAIKRDPAVLAAYLGGTT